jgi:hypothetical protein
MTEMKTVYKDCMTEDDVDEFQKQREIVDECFSVDPEGVVALARQRYWFEDAKQHGVNILRCFIGIESYQITRILGGDATVSERDGKYYYKEIANDDFKNKLKMYMEYQKHKNFEEYMFLGGIRIHKNLIEEYCDHVVKRLRDTMKMTAAGLMFGTTDIDEILGLEHRRQELHDAILDDAGIDRNASDDASRDFKYALSEYVDARAGTLVSRPFDKTDMDDLERKFASEQNEKTIAYLDRMIQVKESVEQLMQNDPSYS